MIKGRGWCHVEAPSQHLVALAVIGQAQVVLERPVPRAWPEVSFIAGRQGVGGFVHLNLVSLLSVPQIVPLGNSPRHPSTLREPPPTLSQRPLRDELDG